MNIFTKIMIAILIVITVILVLNIITKLVISINEAIINKSSDINILPEVISISVCVFILILTLL